MTAEGRPVYDAPLTAPELARLHLTGALRIRGVSQDLKLQFSVPLEIGRELKICEANLLRSWGFGSELGLLTAYAKPRNAPFFRVSDYPSSAFARKATGVTRVMIMVGTNGRGKACRVLRSSGHQDLDQATCRVLMQRAKFYPARNANGNTVIAPSVGLIRWSLPSD